MSRHKLTITHPRVLLVHGELLLLDGLELVPEVELGRLLLELGELVLVLGHLLEGGLNAGEIKVCAKPWTTISDLVHSQFSSQVVDGDVEFVDLRKAVSRGTVRKLRCSSRSSRADRPGFSSWQEPTMTSSVCLVQATSYLRLQL